MEAAPRPNGYPIPMLRACLAGLVTLGLFAASTAGAGTPRSNADSLVSETETPGPEADRPWWQGKLSLRTGADWSSGDYDGSEDTDLWFVPVSLAYEFDDFRLTPYDWDLFELRISTAYIRLRGPDDFFTDGGAGESPRRRTDHGLGDTWVSGTYIFLPKPDSRLPAFELQGKVKAPTADEDRDLGTGEVDGSVELTLFRPFGRVTPMVSAGWRFLGDPDDTNLRSHALASVGGSVRWTPKFTSSLLYAWRDGSAEGRSGSHELVSSFSWKPARNFAVSPYAVWGITGYVPDYALGVTLRYSIPLD